MKKTIFSGITVLGVDESIASDNGAFIGRDREEIDRALKIGVKTHRHDGSAGLPDPIPAPSAQVLASGGAIPGNISLTIGYTLLDLDGGETLISETTLVTTPAPLEVPFTAPTAAFASAGGSLMVDTYTYALTYSDGEGGETSVGPSVTVDRPPGFASGQILLSGLTDGLEAAEAVGWRLYRARGGGLYVLLTEGGPGDDEFLDDGSISPNCDAHPPSDNLNTTKQTNRIEVTLPGSAIVGDATFINLYGSLTGEFGENSLLEQYPAASAGQTVIFESLDFAERQPPDTNRSYGGAPKIDPDVELLDWHWKRPVKTVEDLPTEGNEEGDVRAILEVAEPTVYMFLGGEWQLLELGGGGSSLIVAASGAGGDGGDYLYWCDVGAGTIGRANLDGTEPNPNFITDPVQPRSVFVTATHIYWVDISGNDKIGRAKLDGTEVNNSFITFGVVNITGIAVTSTHIYWTNSQADVIGRANIDGSGVTATFIADPVNPVDIAIDDTYVYWCDEEAIGRAKLDGTEANSSFITTPSDAISMAVNDTHIYWVNEGANSIGRANIDGTGATNSFMTGLKDPFYVAVNDTHIFWSDFEESAVGRAKLDGTEKIVKFVSGMTTPNGVAVGKAYFVDPTERIEFLGSGGVDVSVTDLGSGIALVKIDTPDLAVEGMGVIVHEGVGGTARGTAYKQYTWLGTAEPTKAVNGDIWMNHEAATTKVKVAGAWKSV